jgi:Holliday junction resolvasome RuvABC DNA-binding subunit
LSHGGDHDAPKIILICDGHHKLLHQGLLVITGYAPDHLVFKRDGRLLVDGRSAAELEAGDALREQTRMQRDAEPRAREHELTTQRNVGDSHALVRHGRNQHATRNRFDDVVKLEHAKQALMQLGFKARAARSAVEAACAHVGAGADVATIVKAALQQQRSQSAEPDDKACNIVADAKQALRQLGYPSSIADAAVASASAHVGDEVDLPTLIKEALQRCGGS